MEKKARLNYSGNLDVNAWRERQLAKHIQRLLDERDELFRQRHTGDTDGELLEYVVRKARTLRRMPHPMELEGGQYIQERLGDWAALALSLGYDPPGKWRTKRAPEMLRAQAEEAFLRERRAIKRAREEKRAKAKSEGDGSRVH